MILLGAVALLCGSCTERRRATLPEPDGDTVEVVVSPGADTVNAQ